MRKIKKNKTRARRVLKFLVIFTIIIALILTAGYFLLDHFKYRILDDLVKRIEKKTGGLYSLTYDSAQIDILSKTIEIKNFSINLDRKILGGIKKDAVKTRILVTTARPVLKLKIEGLSILSLILSKTLSINRLTASGGELVILKIKKTAEKPAGSPAKKRLRPLKAFSIKQVKIDKTAFKFIQSDKKNPPFTAASVWLQLSKLRLYFRGKGESSPGPYIYFKTGKVTLVEPVFTFPDGFYTMKAREFDFTKSKPTSSIAVNGLELIPKYKKYRFSKKKGYRSSRVSLTIDNIVLGGLDVDDFFINRRFHGKLLSVNNPVLDIFKNKNIRPNPYPRPKKGIFPQQLLRDLQFKLRIDDVKISGGHIAYTEHAEGAVQAGKIFFSELQANLKNLTNYPELLKKKTLLRLTASAKLMAKSKLNAKITIPVNNKRNFFTFSGSLEKMDMRAFNSILVNNAHIRIKRGTVNGLTFSVSADRNKAGGEMKLLYKNLKVSVLKKVGERKKRKFFSFLANAIIYKANPKRGKPVRIGRIFFKREKPIPFFTFIWKSLRTGIESSMIAFRKSKKRTR